MKKVLMIVIGIVLMLSVVFAVGLSNRDSSVNINKTDVDNIKAWYGIASMDSPNITDLGCDNTNCYFNVKNNIPWDEDFSISIGNGTYNYTDNELVALRDDWIAKRLKDIAKASKERTDRSVSYKDIGGIVTISEK